ncbi:hypothetical protein E0493_08990 [Roseomonas sp. M0104]|uniref:Uncharacterized protein n=1 Tax=Teichococcus coralli TaxID=2545983 RepID=A0A845B763_9PROT|nr:hypothetical protein [Pseudoroseomonas coralli]MXP63483.1 hypothetical protein [Pseudoroseomonas coralli]
MIRSRPIEIDGRFVGVAVTQNGKWRFIATEPAARPVEGSLFEALPQLQRRLQSMLAGRFLPPLQHAG